MSKIRVAINGMGRIGRTLVRELTNRKKTNLEIVAINNPGKPETYVHLLEFDSVHGKFEADIDFNKETGQLSINNQKIAFYNSRNPDEVPWSDCKADIVIDATGVFKDHKGLSAHLGGTVKKVILCAPGKDIDGTFVIGINHDSYDPSKHHIVSNASCTTNCLAPIAKVLNDVYGIESGFMTTIHSYTSDQQLLDGSHSDLRRARAAALSIIPTTTGAAKAVGMVIPDLKGKLDGYAIRVPTPNVSLVDLTVTLKTAASKEEINQTLLKASKENLKGVLTCESRPLVSSDFTGMKESSCVDLALTNVIDKNVKIVSWYDNEAGFSNRVLDLASYIGDKF